MTIAEWMEWAEECGHAGVPVEVGLAHDPLTWADHTTHLDGVPLVVDLDQGAA